MFSDLSVGAVGAALITAIVSFVSLVISKEQKVSEFRQSWIDALRGEITDYLTNINAIADAIGVEYKSHSEKVKALGPLYANLNSALFSITLRLNPDEEKSKSVLTCMKRFEELAHDEERLRAGDIRPIEKDFLMTSKQLLKYEWRRVKRGESTFVIVKAIFGLILAIFGLLLIYYCAKYFGIERFFLSYFNI